MSAPDPRHVITTELIAEIAVLRRALWAVYDECDEEPDIEWNGYRDVDRKAKRIKALLREALEWKR